MSAASRNGGNFEPCAQRDLLAAGFAKGDPADFDPALALSRKHLFAFIQTSQPALWSQLQKEHGANVEQGLRDALQKHLASQGLLTVLRHGFKFFGKTVRVAFFRPSHGLNPDVQAQYDANILTVTRQVPCNPASKETIDVIAEKLTDAIVKLEAALRPHLKKLKGA